MNICEYVRIVSTDKGNMVICAYKPLLELDFSEDIVCDYKDPQVVFMPTNIRGISVFYHKCNLFDNLGEQLD